MCSSEGYKQNYARPIITDRLSIAGSFIFLLLRRSKFFADMAGYCEKSVVLGIVHRHIGLKKALQGLVIVSMILLGAFFGSISVFTYKGKYPMMKP